MLFWHSKIIQFYQSTYKKNFNSLVFVKLNQNTMQVLQQNQLMTTKIFQLLAFALLFLTQFATCQDQDPKSDQQHFLNISQIWGYGFLSGLGVSAIGFFTALVLVSCKNFASDACFQMTIKFLFSLAFGALLGDVVIHILPDAYTVEETDSRITSAVFIISIFFFLILERLFGACGITHQHWHSNQCHDDHEGAIKHHNHPNRISNEENSQNDKSIKNTLAASNTIIMAETIPNKDKVHPQSHQHIHEVDNQNKKEENGEQKSCLQNLKGKGSAGYMNLLGSLIHNFMDGLALGVSFATGDPKAFIPILIAIVVHQIPRQMGDVAILMTNEFSSTQTVLCNGFVNLISLVGVFIGLAVTGVDQSTQQYILVFVAGNFIYIAADIWRHLFKNSGFCKNLAEFCGFAIGTGCMYLILLLQQQQ